MRLVVCVKQVLDPELSPRDFRIDPASLRPAQGSAKLVMDSYAESALEVAMQVKESDPETTVTAICIGDKPADEVLRRTMASAADRAIRVWDPGWTDLDAPAVAHVLARTIHKLGGADLVLTGRQASDVERGLVGPMLAEEIGATCVTLTTRAEVGGGQLQVRRESDTGFEVVASRLPAVLTVTSNESNVPRLPKVKEIMMASRKPIEVLGPADLELDPACMAPGVTLLNVYVPSLDGACEIVEGDDGPGRAAALAHRLREMKVL